MIRIADEIDVVASRNPLVLYDIDTLTDEVEIVENKKLAAVKSMKMTKEAFLLSCETNEEDIYEGLVEMAGKMQKTLDLLQEDFQSIRAGRANPHVLDKLRVDYYGTPSTIQQVANVSVPEPRILMIAPWEKSLLSAIAKEIQKSDIGITPQSDGQVLRLAFPEMTEDRRKELAKEIKKKAEDAKVSLRNIRRDANERTKKMEKSGDYTEDDVKDQEKAIQKLTDKFIKLIDDEAEKKTKDIMTV